VNFSLVSLAQNDKAISMTSGTFKKAFKNFENAWEF